MRPAYPGAEGVGFRCERCGAVFPDIALLQQHRLTAHTVADSRPCGLCGRRFASSEELSSHLRTAHPGGRA